MEKGGNFKGGEHIEEELLIVSEEEANIGVEVDTENGVTIQHHSKCTNKRRGF